MLSPAAAIGMDQVAGSAASARSAKVQTATSGLLIFLFVLSLLLPIRVYIAGLLINPSRLFMLVFFVPFALRLFSGKLGGFTWVDRCMLAFAALMVGTLLYHHGMDAFGFGVSQVLEVFGGYMAGRVMIRSLPDYQRLIRYLLVGLLVLLPFALDEMLHFRMILTDTIGKVVGVIPPTDMAAYGRYGMRRVQSVFPHSILFGLFCSMLIGSIFYLYRKYPGRRLLYLGLVLAMVFSSLSSAPLLSAGLQLGMIIWGKITRGAWKLLAWLVVGMFIFLQLFSNRGAFVIFVETMTLDPTTGWGRIQIWQYGTQNVWANPLLGIGLNDWVRPFWLYSSSVDNFWLLMAMRYGLPCLGFVLLAFLLHLTLLVRVKTLSEDARMLRQGYLITLCALIFMLSTVFVWDAVAVFVFFFLGAGAFLYTTVLNGAAGFTEAEPAAERRTGLGFTRFPQATGRNRQDGGRPVTAAVPVHSRRST